MSMTIDKIVFLCYNTLLNLNKVLIVNIGNI